MCPSKLLPVSNIKQTRMDFPVHTHEFLASTHVCTRRHVKLDSNKLNTEWTGKSWQFLTLDFQGSRSEKCGFH